MKVYGAEVILVSKEEDMEGARDLATKMGQSGEGLVLNQFANSSNYMAHFESTGPEIWRQTDGKITHFVSAMGTTGTITGVSMFLKSKNKFLPTKITSTSDSRKNRVVVFVQIYVGQPSFLTTVSIKPQVVLI